MSLKKIVNCLIVAFAILGITAEIYAVTYEPRPHWPTKNGFFYHLDMAEYPQLLLSTMPYKVMQGYIVADSIVKVAPASRYLPDILLQLHLRSDTTLYLYKYWYLLNEYDPLRFYAFLHKQYHNAKNRGTTIATYMRYRMQIDTKFAYVYSPYILHIKVNDITHIDTAANTGKQWITVVYSQILDILKGGALPSLNNAIFYNGELSSNENAIVGNTYSVPNQTDIVFSHTECVSLSEDNDFTMCSPFDATKNYLIKPNKEYIVFLQFWTVDGFDSKIYYSIYPYTGLSHSIYPIENGNVIDEGNVLGFGEVVPVNVFKQGIRNKINEIKTFGE